MNITLFKKVSLVLGISLGVGSITFAATANINSKFQRVNADQFSIVLNNNNKPSTLTNEYQDNVVGNVKTGIDNDVQISLTNARLLNNGFAQLASRGVVHNFTSTQGAVTGLNTITVDYTGSLTLRTSLSREISNNGITLSDPITVNRNVPITIPSTRYFALEAGDSGANITSIQLGYTCSFYEEIGRINGTYTTSNPSDNNYIYKLELSNGNATLTSVNKPTITSYNGTASLSGSTLNLTFTDGPSYSLNVSDDAYSLSSSGITFYRVYNVEDFESYSEAGHGWTSHRGSSSKYDGTGVMGNYYADFYGNASITSPIGGNGWSMVNSEDYMLFEPGRGYNNSNTVAFKGANYGNRYFQLKAYYGIPQIIGKGTTFSFRARGAVNKLFGDYAGDTTFKVLAYYNSKVTSSNQSTRTEKEFTIHSESSWKEYTMELDSSKNYYAFAIYANNHDSNIRYTPIDDVKIYTHSPYSPIRVTGITLSESSKTLSIGDSHQLTATITPSNADNHNISWTSDNTSVVTVDETGLITATGTGNATITATTEDGNKTATCAITVKASYPSGLFTWYGSVDGGEALIIASIATNGDALLKIDSEKYNGTVESYSSNKFGIHFEGSYDDKTIGYLIGTLDGTTLKDCSFWKNNKDGLLDSKSDFGKTVNKNWIGSAQKFDMTTSNFWDCDGTTAQLQSTFMRRYGNPWNTDTTNADRITSYTHESIGGHKALQLRGYAEGRYALTLANDLSGCTARNIGFWIYNPTHTNETVDIYGYRGADHTSNITIGSVVAYAKEWHFYSIGFGAGTLYNIQFTIANPSVGAPLVFDNIALY